MTEWSIANRLEQAFGPCGWAIDDALLEGNLLTIRGWLIAPRDRSSDVRFTVAGRDFDEVDYPLDRGDLTQLIWYRADASDSGFDCRVRLRADELAGLHVELGVADRATGKPFESLFPYFMPMPGHPERTLPLPDTPRMLRTTGNERIPNFRLTGMSTALQLRAVADILQRDFKSVARVLDWGCGCGRVARFCADWPGFTGADIDADNAQWCRDNLRFGEFGPIGLYPPTPFPDRHFDLIFGISVMTHLAEEVQQQWLAELHRISAPYAIVLLTTLGEHAAARAGLTPEGFTQFVAAGSAFFRTAEAIDDALGSPGYYGTTFMTHDDIRRKWSRWFSIDRIIPAYVGNHQDLVVLRRR
jgi:SAM-dependent methyltransferase